MYLIKRIKKLIYLLPFLVLSFQVALANGEWCLSVPKAVPPWHIRGYILNGVDYFDICGLMRLVLNILSLLSSIGGLIVAIFFILAAIRYISAGANPEKVEGAKKALLAAVIGTVIILLAFVIINILNKVLLGQL